MEYEDIILENLEGVRFNKMRVRYGTVVKMRHAPTFNFRFTSDEDYGKIEPIRHTTFRKTLYFHWCREDCRFYRIYKQEDLPRSY